MNSVYAYISVTDTKQMCEQSLTPKPTTQKKNGCCLYAFKLKTVLYGNRKMYVLNMEITRKQRF